MHKADATFTLVGKSDDELTALLSELRVTLTPDEARKIESDMLGRAPTLTELLLWSVQGSEHCSYKSTREHLKQFVTNGPNVILGPSEDAGIIRVATDKRGKGYGIVMSHESHNHPSQIVPYEGAATGVGGNVRDVCCMGAHVLAISDALRFGRLDAQKTRNIYRGVVEGIAGYGNPIGVPNICTDIAFDDSYAENCLVNVITLGRIREDQVIHSFAPKNAVGYDLILVGKATDMSGFGGASFASMTLSEEQKQQNKGAVQEPNAFLKRHLLVAHYALFNKLERKGELQHVGLKDLGAGGIACASVELAEAAGYGAKIRLDQVPTSISNLHPSIVLLSETQERFMWVVPKRLTQTVLDHFNDTFELGSIAHRAQATVIGEVTDDGKYIVTHGETVLVDAAASDVTSGLLYHRPYHAPSQLTQQPSKKPKPHTCIDACKAVLRHHNVCSREAVTSRYDGQVQGNTILDSSQAPAGVLQPFYDESFPEEIREVGVALSAYHDPGICTLDPYIGTQQSVLHAMNHVVAVGASPWALTDCLNFGNPEIPEQMWEFVEATRAISDVQHSIRLSSYPTAPVPIISGNVSLYNATANDHIAPSAIIGCLGRIPDVTLIPAQTALPGQRLYLVGQPSSALAGSVFGSLFAANTDLPETDLPVLESTHHTMLAAIRQHLIGAIQPVHRGGLIRALSLITRGTTCGTTLFFYEEETFFAESPRLLVSIRPNKESAFVQTLAAKNAPYQLIGHVTDDAQCVIADHNTPWTNLHAAFDSGLPSV